jgi:hypothetical protein
MLNNGSMFSFAEWLLHSESARWADYEVIPDRLPKTGDIVILFDEPKANILNKNVYKVLKSDGDNLYLYKPYVQPTETLTIDKKSWGSLTPVTHLLTSAEKKGRDWAKGFTEIWAIGQNKDRWISNREKTKKQIPTQAITFNPLHHAMVKQSFMQPTEPSPEDLAVQKARASLFGGEEPKSKTPEDLAKRVRLQWARR